ncbi:hypothetical protein T484DRAFT_1909801 [Baffinella frigidus]|nr:hypothetical protein T484DRAFT_1909801 [Cryptophyta sp. CCMP2293]
MDTILRPCDDGESPLGAGDTVGDEIDSSLGDQSLIASVHRADQSLLTSMTWILGAADQSLLTSMTWILGAVCIVGAGVFVGYTRGHQPTVDLVVKAKTQARNFLEHRSSRGQPLAGSGRTAAREFMEQRSSRGQPLAGSGPTGAREFMEQRSSRGQPLAGSGARGAYESL